MKYLKVKNIKKSNGEMDYKSLDINTIREPYYSINNDECVIKYEAPFTPHEDLIEITFEEYISYKTVDEDSFTLEERLKNIETTLDIILLGGV